MRRILNSLCGFALCFGAGRAAAMEVTVHVGPPSIGNGGSNPISVPPVDLQEYEVTLVTKSGFESNIAITPGLLFGIRDTFNSDFYVSFGGGLVIDANGTGPGAYSAFGIDRGQKLRFNFEYKQALGFDFGSSTMLCPYAVRIGASYVL